MLSAENILTRIDELLRLKYDQTHFEVAGEVYAGTVALASQIWGENCGYVQSVKQLREDTYNSRWTPQYQSGLLPVSKTPSEVYE